MTGPQRTNGQAGNCSGYAAADQSRPAHAVGIATGRALPGDPVKNLPQAAIQHHAGIHLQ